MSERMFAPGPHDSHDWHRFEESDEADQLMCHRCEICTCHSPVASTEQCEFAKGGAS